MGRQVIRREMLGGGAGAAQGRGKETQKKRLNEKFRALNVALEAIDKQIPKKPIGGFDFSNNEYKICCDCSAIAQDREWKANYCPDCGQALDWSEEI